MDANKITVAEQFSRLYQAIGCKSAGTRDDLMALIRVAQISDENARLRQLIASLLELVDKHTDLPASASNGQHSYFSEPPTTVWFIDCGLHQAHIVMKQCRAVTNLPPGRENDDYKAVYDWKKPPASPSLCASPPCGDGEMGGQKNTP